jgi:hypothetical protein
MVTVRNRLEHIVLFGTSVTSWMSEPIPLVQVPAVTIFDRLTAAASLQTQGR